MKILNLTQHDITKNQEEAGVCEPKNKTLVREKLTFETLPTLEEIQARSKELVKICQEENYQTIMLGGAQYLLPFLVKDLQEAGFIILFAYTKRLVEESFKEDGSVIKVFHFKHEGFVHL